MCLMSGKDWACARRETPARVARACAKDVAETTASRQPSPGTGPRRSCGTGRPCRRSGNWGSTATSSPSRVVNSYLPLIYTLEKKAMQEIPAWPPELRYTGVLFW